MNGVPTAPVVSINPDPATTSDALTVNIDDSSTDPEGNIATYTYEWLLGQVQASIQIPTRFQHSANKIKESNGQLVSFHQMESLNRNSGNSE